MRDKQASSPQISLRPSCSDWCPLHLASPVDTPGYGSGGGSAAQMARELVTTCPAPPRTLTPPLADAKNRPESTWLKTSNGKSISLLRNIPQTNGQAWNPTSQRSARTGWLQPERVPSGSLVLSVFHNPAPTGSYGTMSRRDGLWNILLVDFYLFF